MPPATDGISVRLGGHVIDVPFARLDAVEPIVEVHAIAPGVAFMTPDSVEPFGRALFGGEWPTVVAAAADALELADVLRTTYVELADASGRIPAGRA